MKINKNCCITDEDILNDILLCEKMISNNYSVAINEMSNKYLYKIIMNIFDNTKNISREMFNLMYSKNWYTLSAETDKKIDASREKYSNKLEELN